MNTILFATIGIVSLAGLSYLTTHIEYLKNIRWKERLAKFRRFGEEPNI